MTIQLSDHFTYKKIFRFCLAPIIVMIFSSIYSIVDGLFISRFASTDSFAAVNFEMPLTMMISAIGFMFGSGGTAIIGKALGEGDSHRANQYLANILLSQLVLGLVFTLFGELFLPTFCTILGAEGKMREEAILYGRISIGGVSMFMLQNTFQSIMVVAKKQKLGLILVLSSGVTNIVLDALFIGVFHWGVAGAAIATLLGQSIGGLVPFLYFFNPHTDALVHYEFGHYEFKPVAKACGNGISELIVNISSSLVSMLFNYQLLKYIGNNGVSAYGFIMYVSFIFVAFFIGYNQGMAPIVAYNYGAKNTKEIQNIFRKSLVVFGIASVVMFGFAEAMNVPLSYLFTGQDEELYALSKHAFFIYSFSFLLIGWTIFASAFFTALNNGWVSGIISFSKSLVFEVASIMLLPLAFGMEGIWLAPLFSSFCSCLLSFLFLFLENKVYHYIK